MATQKRAGAMIGEWGAYTSLLTTIDTYVDVGTTFTLFYKTVRFLFTAATNHLKIQILGSIDGGTTFTETAEAEFTLNAAASVSKTIIVPYTHMKVQVKPAAGGAHGTIATKYMGASA